MDIIKYEPGNAGGAINEMVYNKNPVFYIGRVAGSPLPEGRGSITIETALVLPLFLFGMFLVMDLFSMFAIYMGVERALDIEAKKLATVAYEDWGPSEETVKADILSILSENYGRIPVAGGEDGLSLGGSDLHNREIIAIQADYIFEPAFDIFDITNIEMTHRRVMHTWIGYEQGLYGRAEDGEDIIVYVARNGTVYHRSIACSHIRLSISETTGAAVGSLRNADGARYKPCSYCHARISDGVLYVAANGDRFHNSLNCGGLTRTVRSMRLSEAIANGLRGCSRCGGSL